LIVIGRETQISKTSKVSLYNINLCMISIYTQYFYAHSPQAIMRHSARRALSTWVTAAFYALFELRWSDESFKDETHVCGCIYTFYISFTRTNHKS